MNQFVEARSGVFSIVAGGRPLGPHSLKPEANLIFLIQDMVCLLSRLLETEARLRPQPQGRCLNNLKSPRSRTFNRE